MKSVLLIGLGRFGRHLAKTLDELGHQVMAIDRNEALINDVLSIVTSAQIGDSTNEDFLSSLGVSNYDICIVAIGNDFQSSMETTALLKELGAKMVISRCASESHGKFLLRNGADDIIYPEGQVAKWTAIRYSAEHILDFIEIDENFAIFEVITPDEWVGKTIEQIDIRRKYGISIMAIKEQGRINITIDPDRVLQKDETILVVGQVRDIQNCLRG